MINRIRKGIVLLLTAMMIATGVVVALTPPVYASPDEGGRVPYQFVFDNILSRKAGDSRMVVLRNLQLDLGQPLEASGWVATSEGVTNYQYLWLPTGEQQGEWTDVTTMKINHRPDLEKAGIPYSSGHSTAGFSISITPPEDLAEGYYNVYIRAVDGMGVPCDLAALLDLRYGAPDLDDGKKRVVSFPRILREGADALKGDVTVTEEGISLGADGSVHLGNLNLATFEQLRITYVAAEARGESDGRRAVLGLKSAGTYSYGVAGESYNLTDDLVYAAFETAGTLEIDLTDLTYRGEVWLTGYLGETVTVTGIELIYNGYGSDRVAAKIYLSEDILGYFSGGNATEVKGVSDPMLGDVVRLEASQDTNDPYVYFSAGSLLGENDIRLNADEYKYMVILYRADKAVNGDYMSLYLCSGNITGATEACNQGVKMTRDGKWHYVLVDLTHKENWGGLINGWRFDYVNADTDKGDGVEFASVQFFRTYEGAFAAASQSISEQSPYRKGDPAIIRDMSEEGEDPARDFVIPPEDSYVVSEETTFAEDTTVAVPDATEQGEMTPTNEGCGAALTVAVVPTAILLAVGVLSLRKKE